MLARFQFSIVVHLIQAVQFVLFYVFEIFRQPHDFLIVYLQHVYALLRRVSKNYDSCFMTHGPLLIIHDDFMPKLTSSNFIFPEGSLRLS